MPRGRFISIEGGEGSGKSTQLRALATALRERGIDVVETREPGGTEGAEAIRDLLLGGTADRWTPETEALLFAAARSDHVARLIRPALEAGKWVLSDRFLDSSRAYQGAASGVSDDAIMRLHEIGSGGLLPDRTLLLALPGDEGEGRADARDGGEADRIGGRNREYHASVRGAFADYARRDPQRFRIADASASVEQVTRTLLAALSDYLPNGRE